MTEHLRALFRAAAPGEDAGWCIGRGGLRVRPTAEVSVTALRSV
jgi:hypothetical protein